MTAPHARPCARSARAGRELRLLRAAVFAAVCVVLAACGHTLASCATVPLWSLGAGFLGALVVVVPLAGRERSLPGIVALLALGQTVLHALFGLGQHTAGTAGSAGTAAASASDGSLVAQAARLVCGATAAQLSPVQAQRILADARVTPTAMHHPADALSTSPDSMASLLPSLPMLLGHVLAALAAGWLLRHGDLALLRLAGLAALSAREVADGALVRSLRAALALVRALLAGLPAAPQHGPRLPRTEWLAPRRPAAAALQHTVIRRGPPAAAFDLAA
ncbi:MULTISPECIES: hypothetical protein [Streptomyces]|uniref:Integral membrane protein n=2 Tax=Streptomyces TaxID=1883 RepID=A0A2U9P3Z0_STRAS|nr:MULTISPECIES: hypothetical protein [Streptomyces]AWT44232.1 hypothetical protein DMT42_19240 [Streptomyces actuosus]MBM4820611.1 hypothetical protein [Streptomyces actuosus]GHF73010.1 hypothetical protein GCM10018783_48070 [Streptomyces griseosporeus]